MKSPVHILHLDDNSAFSDVIKAVLEVDDIPCAIERVETRADFLSSLATNKFDIVISEYKLPSFDGLSALAIVNKQYPHIPFIFFSESYDEGAAIECMKSGAKDFVTKLRISWLAVVVSRVLQESERRLERQQGVLNTSQEFAQSIINSSLDMIIAVNMNRRIIEFNKAAEQTFRYLRDEVIGQHVDILYAKPRQGLRIYKTAVMSGKCVEEVMNKRKDGTTFRSLLSASLIHNAQGELTGVMGVSRDITEMKRSEEKLREQAALLDIAHDAIIIQSVEGHIAYWNQSAERIYGWSATEAIGRLYSEIVIDSNGQHGEECKKSCLKKGEWRGALHQKTKAGSEIIVESRWTLVKSVEGKPKAVFIVNTDITEQKKLEHQLLRAQRIESIGTLAGGISHDLNNVLTPILGGLHILKRKATDEQTRQLLETLESSAKRGTDIVKQVLTFARGAEGEKVILQPKHLIREIEKIIRETFPKSIQTTRHVARELWTVYGDATQLHQVLLNLCVNARDAMPNGGALTITADNIIIDENYARMNVEATPGPYVVMTVSDTGTGIPSGIMDKIFEPFFTTKELGKGTGLGLATVLALVKSHRGFLNVYSEPGKGTTFKVYIPAAEAAEAHTSEEQLELAYGAGETILVVDDEDSILSVTKQTLETSGYHVLTASDGTEAVALLAQNRKDIDVVVTDMMMPFLDGPATIRALRKIDPRIRIIATSGLIIDGRLVEAQNLGVQAFITKPYTAQSLLGALSEVLHVGYQKAPPGDFAEPNGRFQSFKISHEGPDSS